MTRAAPGPGRWMPARLRVSFRWSASSRLPMLSWLPVLLALAVRLGAAASPQLEVAIQDRAAAPAVLCSGQVATTGADGSGSRRHHPADPGATELMLAGEALDHHAPPDSRVVLPAPDAVAAVAAPVRFLPPGRGPPPRTARVGAPRAPPLPA